MYHRIAQGGIGTESPRIKSPGKTADPFGVAIENQRVKGGGLRFFSRDFVLKDFILGDFVLDSLKGYF